MPHKFLIPAQRAKKYDPKKSRIRPWDVAQEKIDGHRIMFFVQPDKSVVAFGRDQRPHLEMFGRYPSLLEHPTVSKICELPRYSIIDAEVITLDQSRSDVVTALKEGPNKYEIKAFGTPWFDNRDCHDDPLSFAEEICGEYEIPFAETLTREMVRKRINKAYAPHQQEKYNTLERDYLLELASGLGIEGWVLKTCIGGKWWKVKHEHTVDCIVTSVKGGEGKYDGMIGAIVCSVYDDDGNLQEIASSSGMSDSVRENMTLMDLRGDLEGQVVELKYQLVGAKGRLTHPRFVRFRPDKPVKECTHDQLVDV